MLYIDFFATFVRHYLIGVVTKNLLMEEHKEHSKKSTRF